MSNAIIVKTMPDALNKFTRCSTGQNKFKLRSHRVKQREGIHTMAAANWWKYTVFNFH